MANSLPKPLAISTGNTTPESSPGPSHTSTTGGAPIPTLRLRYVETHSQKSACAARIKPASEQPKENPVVHHGWQVRLWVRLVGFNANGVSTRDCAFLGMFLSCLLYTSPSPRDGLLSRMPSS